MIRINVNLGERSYPILIGHGIADKLNPLINGYIKSKKIMLITNTTVNKLYGKKVIEQLRKGGFSVYLIVTPDGEKYKNIEQAKIIYKECIKNKMHRDSCIISLGGGVISDLAGFAAATYMRGIDLINIPTTLIGQIDAAIGGKTGINFEAKNIIGSFHQPKAVVVDTTFLKTLPQKEIKNGVSEIIKYAVIKDKKLFRFLERNKEQIIGLDNKVLINIISRCCLIKTRIVEKDEKEQGIRVILNYGHTVGHAIEKVSKYNIPHGEAVAIGMIKESNIAKLLGILDKKQQEKIENLIKGYSLAEDIKIKKREILEAIQIDKKAIKEKIRFVLPSKIGRVCVTAVPLQMIEKVL